MTAPSSVTDQPVFYLFVAATILLSLGYSWGRRRNGRIAQAVLGAVVKALSPTDHSFTNIGGLTGYHLNLVLPPNPSASRVEGTLLLLPRQSWLYFPLSLLIRRHDRLYLAFQLTPELGKRHGEAHLVERRYASTAEGRVANADALETARIVWGTREFLAYSSDSHTQTRFRALVKRLPDPGPLRHIALVPEIPRLHLYLVPQPETTHECVRTVYEWLCDPFPSS